MGNIGRWFLILVVAATAKSQILTADQNLKLVSNGLGRNLANVSTKCGKEVLTEPDGRIDYKLSEPLGPNERCVWPIFVEAGTAYTLNIISLGFPSSDLNHQLQITAFSGNGVPLTKIYDQIGTYEFPTTEVLLVTFFTGNSSDVVNHTGFSLEYTTDYAGSPFLYKFHAVFRNSSEEANSEYGVIANKYTPTMTIFIWNWDDNTYSPSKTMKIFYGREGEWTSVGRVEAYKFHPESSWQLSHLIDVNTYSSSIIQSRDLTMFAYRSNNASYTTQYIRFANFNCEEGDQ